MAAYHFLDEERARLHAERQQHVTLGQARREVQHHASLGAVEDTAASEFIGRFTAISRRRR